MKSNISKKQSKELDKTLKEAQQALKNIEGLTSMIQDVTSMAKEGIDTEELENITTEGKMEATLDSLKAEDLESLLKQFQALFPQVQQTIKEQEEAKEVLKNNDKE
jgi:phage tail tape-measure protein